MNIVHITFGESACGNLKSVLPKNEQIICINEDFSIGPIYKLEKNEGLLQRKHWLKEILLKTGPASDKDYLDWIETVLTNNLQIYTEVPSNCKVILWHGANASDQIGLRFVVSLLQHKDVEFEEVNVTEYSSTIDFKVRDIQNKEIPYILKSLGGMPPELILNALQMKKSLSHDMVQSLIEDWKKWAQTNEILRIVSDGKIEAVSEDYYDEVILENTSNEYQKATRVVGEVIAKSDQNIGEKYLAYRVYQLIEQGKLSFQGSLGHFREIEIKLP